nr:MAG TPA: protein of unknown function DUF2190 [Bacteriophage sp.]DAY11637.1 MAG TPA: protein of unknown function DUF2190 [Bacteriophage sp.]
MGSAGSLLYLCDFMVIARFLGCIRQILINSERTINMAKNYMQDGNTVRFTATAAVKSGDVVMLENLAAISVSDVVQNETGVGLTTGVFTVKAKAEDDIKQGAIVYWSATDGATITAGSNKRLGIAWHASGASMGTVDVKINA